MKKLVSMEIKKGEEKQEAACAPCEVERPKYPYGTSLYLDEVAMKKLGMKEMPSVGTEIPVIAIAKVTGTSEREYEDGKRQSLDLQITSMAFDLPEEPTTPMGKAAQKLYG